MLPRALLVFLAVMNLGVGLWWLLRPAASASATGVAQAAAPRLQLLGERSGDAPPPVAPLAADPQALPTDAACISLGPFADAASAALVAERLPALRSRVSERASGRVRGWRVLVPPQASAEAAVALAGRIEAAGFRDYFVMRTGSDTNAIALGRFQTEQAARRHAAALTAAGFPVQAEPLGGGPATTWLDLALAGDTDPDAVQASAGVTEQRPIDCETLQ